MAGNLGTTAADLIVEALSILGVYSQGDNLDASDEQSAMFTFNGILDGWGAEPLTIYSVTAAPYSTVPNLASYTLGPPGLTPACNWVTPGPLPSSILQIGRMVGTQEFPVNPRTEAEYAHLGLKSMLAGYVSDVYISYGVPFHTVTFWPVPNIALPIVLYLANAVPRLTAPSNVIALPAGYQEALTFELALKCAAKFGKAIPQYLPDAWDEAKHKIKARNWRPDVQRVDPALQPHSNVGGGWLGFYEGR